MTRMMHCSQTWIGARLSTRNLDFTYRHRKKSNGVIAHDLGAHWSVFLIMQLIFAMGGKWCRLVETKYRWDHELHLHATNCRFAWRDNCYFYRNISTKPLLFLDEMAALESLQVTHCAKCGSVICLHTYLGGHEPHCRTKFGSKMSDLHGTFQGPIEGSDVAWENRAASVLARFILCMLSVTI